MAEICTSERTLSTPLPESPPAAPSTGRLEGTVLRPEALEAEFRARDLRSDGRVAAVAAAGMSFLWLLFVPNDLTWGTASGWLPYLLALRGAGVLLGLTVVVVGLRARRAATLDFVVLAWSIGAVSLTAAIQASRPADYDLPVMWDAVVVLLTWTLIPNRFAFQAVEAVAATASCVVWLGAFREPLPRPSALFVAVTLAMANGAGAFISWRIHRSRRLQFLAVKEEQAAAERSLRSAELFRTAFENASIGKVLTDPGGRILRVNEAMCRLLGHEAAELVGRPVAEITHPEDRAASAVAIEEMLRGAPQGQFEKRYVRKDGHVVWAVVSASLVRDSDGAPVHFVVGVMDVTARRRAEEELAASRSRYADLYDSLGDGVVRVDEAGRILEYNEAYRRMLGYAPGELEGRSYVEITPERWHAFEARIVGEQVSACRHAAVYEKEYRRRDGTVFPIEIRSFVEYEDRRPVRMWAIVRDITERRRAEHALQESESRFRALAEGSPVGIVQTDTHGLVVYVNRACAAIAGVVPESAVGRPWSDFVHPDDRERIHREGKEAVQAGRAMASEYRLLRPDGKEAFIRAFASRLRDGEGRPAGHIGIAIEITEERALRERLAVTSRLAALGTLVAGVAHEINNPLGGALASHGFVADELQRIRDAVRSGGGLDRGALVRQLDEVLDALADAQAGEQRIAGIVKDLSLFGRPDARRTRVRLFDVAEGAMRWLPPALGARSTVRVVDGKAPDVVASEGQLVQVVANLVTNAAKAMPSGRRGKVEVRLGPAGPGRACVEVVDDGNGMTPDVMERIFDPFFTTRAVGQGMGLGLAIVHAIVTAHGGTISVASTPGEGSTFRVELPAAEAARIA